MHLREKTQREVCQIPVSAPLHVSTYAFLQGQKERLLECFLSQDVLVYDTAEHTLNLGLSQTEMRILPVRFTVEFKDDFVTLYLLAP